MSVRTSRDLWFVKKIPVEFYPKSRKLVFDESFLVEVS